ncbi:TonB-dependent receptor [candidate division KSB1 bacterium]|nr:TonB-dependent receptor [candidate division KSB1 bacterium]
MFTRFNKPVLIFLATVLLSLYHLEVNASTYGKVAGKVVDNETKEPLIGVNVFIEGIDYGASTDADGEYVILNVHPGTYVLKMMHIGYVTQIKEGVQVSVNRTTRIDAALNPTVIEGATVTVTAQRDVIEKDLTASEQFVTRDVLDKSWVRTIPEVLETQAGVFQNTFRGSSNLQSLYLLDNMSVNSGLLSDNYTGFNTTMIEEISVLTGGYNAEYGSARSAIVNVVSKEATDAIHGTFLTRMRPAGKYHYGANFYDEDNYDYTHFDLDYWTAESQNIYSNYYGQDPDTLLAMWRQQTTPNDTLSNYTERYELEYEGTLYGPITNDLGFLLSGRFKKGVGRYPQLIPYNTDYNFQGYLKYNLSPQIKLKVGGFIGGWESAEYLSVNFNTLESAQESEWLGSMQVYNPYSDSKYRLYAAVYRQWPELRKWYQGYLKMTHVLNNRTFYEITLSYLNDDMDRSNRYGTDSDELWSRRDDKKDLINHYYTESYFHAWDKMNCEVFQLNSQFVSQIGHHLLKFGTGFNAYDFSYEHFMGVHEGGSRWNLLNVFDGKPYEGNVYLQDKIEFSSIIINAGLRADYFHQNRKAPTNMFDPLAIQPSTPGHDPAQPLGIPGDPELKDTKLQYAFSPRLGISHPISENSILHFAYGHFYQRPSWTKMFGFPFTNYTEDMDNVLDPYAQQTTYPEEWQGWYGNGEMGFERTVQYELGVDINLYDRFKFDLTGYYKDASMEASVITGLYGVTYNTTKHLMMSNAGYSDVRGIETKIDSRWKGPFNVGVGHDVYWSFYGEVGYSRLYEPGSTRINVPKGLRQGKGAWSSYHKIKSWANIYFETGRGPEIAGYKPLDDFNVYLYFWWRSGDPYTYHGPGDLSTKPLNKRWFNYYQTNLKISKGFNLLGVRAELSADFRNLFNQKFLRLLYDDDLIRWHENSNLSQEDRLPKVSFSGEPNTWGWYSYEVPPREIYLQFKIDF